MHFVFLLFSETGTKYYSLLLFTIMDSYNIFHFGKITYTREIHSSVKQSVYEAAITDRTPSLVLLCRPRQVFNLQALCHLI